MSLSRKKTLLYSLIPAVVLFASLETAARIAEIWRPPLPVDYGWGFDPGSRLFVPSDIAPGLMITNPSKRVSFQEQQFQMPKPAGAYRIFAVGGSSVNYAWTAIPNLAWELTKKLDGPLSKSPRAASNGAGGQKICQIINAGGCAYGTHRLVAIVSEIMAYEPDLILLFTGHNEFEEVEQMELARLAMLPLQEILYKSALCRFVRDRIAGLDMARRRQERNRAILREAPTLDIAGKHQFTEQEIAERMTEFRDYLSAIVMVCQSHGVPLILGTAPSNLWQPSIQDEAALDHARELYDAGQYDAGMAYVQDVLRHSPRHQASGAENEIIRGIASRHHLPLADVEATIAAAEPHHVPGETLFIDRCHFTKRGNEILCDTFKEQILALLRSG